LGEVKIINNVKVYVKNEDCIHFLKDLIKDCRNDNKEKITTKLILAKYDLLEILVSLVKS